VRVHWLREPLLHFLLIGALLFGLFALTNKVTTRGENVIKITQADIEQLQLLFQRQWQRPPTPQELQTLVDGLIREEVLYREALALGLDRNDTIVRRRMAQKVEFLVADTAVPAEPDTAALTAYYDKNKERYREPARLSFNHIYFSTDKRGLHAEKDAEAALKRLRPATQARRNAAELGDRFMLAYDYAQRGTDELAREFGGTFAEEIAKAPVGQWYGPVTSGYGIHLVYVSARTAARIVPLANVRDRVAADWLIDQRREANDRVFERLRSRYEIVVDEGRKLNTAKAVGE